MTEIEFPKKTWPFLFYFLKTLSFRQKMATVSLLFITATIVVSNAIMMYGFKLLVDAIPNTPPDQIWQNAKGPFWIVVICCAFHTTFYRVRDYIDMHVTPYVQNSLREMLMMNVMKHSQDYFANRFSGELANKVSNVVSTYRNLLWERLLHGFIPTAAAIFSSCVLLYVIDPNLAFLLAGITVLLILSIKVIGPPLSRASADMADREADISGQVVDTLTNIASVRNFSNANHEISLLQLVQRPYLKAYRRLVWWEIIFWGAFDIIISALVIGSIYYLITRTGEGSFTAGEVSACILIAWDSWYRLAHLSWQLSQMSADSGRMQSALNEFVKTITVRDRSGAVPFTPRDGTIEVRNVSFTYDSGAKIFENFSLDIPASQKVGLVGLSGAGKTTLCQLLLRNFDVGQGGISIGGQDIAGVQQETLRRNIAVIPQDPTLFHRSLLENIRYGMPDATFDDVVNAAKAAQAHDFILSTPNGYETMVGERGVKLSGGQRQRIAIARAILKNAPILILDEATSALDSDTERSIQSALNTAMEGRTTLVIAHRLSTLVHLDRLIVMKDGQIAEDGTLDELIAKNGHFAYLWNLQAGGFLPEKLGK